MLGFGGGRLGSFYGKTQSWDGKIWDWVRSTEQTGVFQRKTQILEWKIWGLSGSTEQIGLFPNSNPRMGKFGIWWGEQSKWRHF